MLSSGRYFVARSPTVELLDVFVKTPDTIPANLPAGVLLFGKEDPEVVRFLFEKCCVADIGGFIRKYNGWFSNMENYIRGFLQQKVKPTADITLRLLQLSSSSISFIGVETDLYVTCYFSAISGTFFDGIYAAYMTNAGMENPVCSIGGRLVCLKG